MDPAAIFAAAFTSAGLSWFGCDIASNASSWAFVVHKFLSFGKISKVASTVEPS
jgi:hypothetical protein